MPSEEEEIIRLISQELKAGKAPQAVVNELVQAGLPRNEAVTVVNAVAQQMGSRGGAAPAAAPRKSSMGYYMWLLVAIGVLVYIAMM